ncbi:MAG TPA: hypothetical protein VN915_07990 [Elusimicrobiota bacterium]|nr:hypothetical protein [Elusimicrobiota bacterium]
MTDETREELSAYIDNALPENERRDLESRLAASAELRGALEDLRAVSRAVRDLPKEPLPPGFMVRFQARRARGDAPRADWVFLPPAARPVVGALSFGVIALMIWSRVQPAQEQFLHPDEAARVAAPGNAPVSQLDLHGMISGTAGPASSDAKSLEIAGAAQAPERPRDKDAVLEGGAGAAADEMKASAKISGVSAVRGANGRAAGAPIAAPAAPAAAAAEPQLTDRTRTTMSEEERSARNEQLFAQLEGQKKEMGMRVLPKGEEAGAGTNFLGLREPPAAPAIRAPVPSLLKAKKKSGALADTASVNSLAAKPAAASAAGRLAPDAGLVFGDAGSLASSWVLLGLPGDPPSFDFSNGRVVVIKPSSTKILSVTPGADSVQVVFRTLEPDEASDPAKDRVAPLPSSPKTVLIYDASPR